jgi:hypothetical protein
MSSARALRVTEKLKVNLDFKGLSEEIKEMLSALP